MTSVPAVWAGLGLAAGLMFCVWLASLVRRDASLVDRFWGAGFVVVAWFYLWTAPPGGSLARTVLVGAVTIWGIRLSVYLTIRNWGKGEDYRYGEMRAKRGASFGVISLFTVFLLQGVILWVVALPLYAGLRSTGPSRPSILLAGVLVWVVGFAFEVIGDAQLARHRADAARRGRVLDRGVWRYTRHPNYFGDAAVWWGHWLMAVSVGGAWTVVGPLLMNWLLVRVSGVSLLEKKLKETRAGYAEYVARTSAFFPRPPRPG